MTIPRDRLTLILGGAPPAPLPPPTYASNLLEFALQYATHGYRVIPVWWVTQAGGCACSKGAACGKSAGKHPIPSDWPTIATTNEAEIRSWWSKWPLANVGLAMGQGIVAVDIDNHYALEELDAQGLPINTPTQHTGSGGFHRLLRWSGKKLKNAVRFIDGADLRTDGGFIVVEPSVNLRGPYRWDPDHSPFGALADLPSWIADACAVENAIKKPSVNIADLWDGVPEGKRNGRLFSYACKMRRDKRPELEIMAVCLELGRRCVPPLFEDEIASVVASSGRYADKREDDGLVCVAVWPDLMQMDLKPKNVIITPWLRERDIFMVHAWRGIGKTWVTLSLGVAVTTGGMFFKWPVTSPRGVLLIDGEMSLFDLRHRIAALMKGAGGTEPKAPFRLIANDMQEGGIPSLDTSKGQDLVERHLDGIGVVIIDNVSTLFRGGGDENDSSSWDAAQEWLLSMRRRGLTTGMVHHSGKSGAQRGTSKREDILDAVLNCRRPADYREEQGARFEIKFEKLRGVSGRAVEPFEVQLESSGNSGACYWTIRSQQDTRDEQIIEMVELGMAQNVMAQELGCSRSTLARVIRKLRQDGKLSAKVEK